MPRPRHDIDAEHPIVAGVVEPSHGMSGGLGRSQAQASLDLARPQGQAEVETIAIQSWVSHPAVAQLLLEHRDGVFDSSPSPGHQAVPPFLPLVELLLSPAAFVDDPVDHAASTNPIDSFLRTAMIASRPARHGPHSGTIIHVRRLRDCSEIPIEPMPSKNDRPVLTHPKTIEHPQSRGPLAMARALRSSKKRTSFRVQRLCMSSD